MLSTAIKRAGYQVDEAADGNIAAEKIRKQPYQLVITDLRLPTLSGLEILKIQKETDATIPFLLMTAFGTIEEAVEAMKQGAFDFVPKPVDISHLLLLINRAVEQRRLMLENILLKEESQQFYGIPTIIGDSAAIQTVSQVIQRVAPTDATVLLTGESGTGKEVFSRAIHIPPLRERISDVRLLAQFFVEKFSKDLHRQGLQLTPEAAKALEEYSWPGNVRELQNTIERAVILSDGKAIQRQDLNFAFQDRKRPEDFVHYLDLSGSLSDVSSRAAQAAEKVKIKQALELNNWNKTQAAEALNVSYKTLLNKVKDYGLE